MWAHTSTLTQKYSDWWVSSMQPLLFSLFSHFCPWISTSLPLFLLHPPISYSRKEKKIYVCVCVSVVYHFSCEALVKLSVLSANFTTCVKLKAVMWKRCLPSFSLFLSHPISPFLPFYSFSFTRPSSPLFVYFPHPITPPFASLFHPLLCIILLLKSVCISQRGSGVLDAHEWGDLLWGCLGFVRFSRPLCSSQILYVFYLLPPPPRLKQFTSQSLPVIASSYTNLDTWSCVTGVINVSKNSCHTAALIQEILHSCKVTHLSFKILFWNKFFDSFFQIFLNICLSKCITWQTEMQISYNNSSQK